MQKRIVLKNCGQIDPKSINSFLKKGGFAALETVQKQMTLQEPGAHEEEIFGVARVLLGRLLVPGRRCRLVGVKVSHLIADAGGQMELDMLPPDRRETLHRRLDALQDKHGYGAIHWGITHSLRRWR